MTYIVSPLAGLVWGISWRPPAYSLLYHNTICTNAHGCELHKSKGILPAISCLAGWSFQLLRLGPQADFWVYGWLFKINGCFSVKPENCGKGILWLKIIAGYQIYGFFSAKSENIEEEILQLKILVATKFNVKPIGYIQLPVFSFQLHNLSMSLSRNHCQLPS